MRVLITLPFALILAAGISVQTAPGAWSSKAAIGMPRTETGAAFINGRIYVVAGGLGTMESSTLVQEYDVKTDKWRERAPLPMALSHAGVAALNGKLFVVGGFLKNVHLYAQPYAFEYDPGKNSWRTLPWMKAARGSVGVVSLGGKIHAVGGRGIDRVTVGTHEVYDPATNRWTDAAPLPQPRDHAPTVVAEGRIHVLGGRFDATADNTDVHSVYDPATNTWSSAPFLPEPRSGGSAVLYRDRIVLMGGECDKGKTFSQNEAYDLKATTWTTLAPMPGGRHGFYATTDGQAVYVAAGSPNCGGGSSDTLMLFTLPGNAATH
jgi:Galactose oxidase, central domain/Kelch motif